MIFRTLILVSIALAGSATLETKASAQSKGADVKLSYTIIYVADVAKTVDFYERAFGIKRRFIHESGQYAEMETGQTTLGFTANEFAQSLIPGGFRENKLTEVPAGIQITLTPPDVENAFNAAVKAGATPVAKPELKPWGWACAFVRDLNGVLVEIAKEVESSK